MVRSSKRVEVCLQAAMWIAALAAIGCTPLAAQTATVPAEDARNTNIVTTNTHLPLPAFASLKAWQERKALLRNQILVATGLSPYPEKTPLHAQIFGKIEERGYTIEKVLIETLPGFYLGGNLYRPRDGRAKHPAVLNPHGHWPYGRLENEPIDSGPAFGISLARQGYVVFAYDMVGYTDTIQVPHRFGSVTERLWSFGPMGLQLWDSIRGLDFLASLEDVDADHLGMAGASGGATQTLLLTAVDDRVQFASPVNMISAFMQGGDLCENAPGLRLNTSNVEIAAMFAPKPMLVVSDTTDWTRNVPREEYPAIKRIYDLYGKGDQVSVVQIEAVHNFNQQSREAVYRFFAQVNPGLSDSHELTEHNITVPMLQEMMALSGRTLPANALDLNGLFHEWRAMAEAQNAQPRDAAFLRERLRQTLAVQNPANVIAETHGESIVLGRSDWKDRLAGIAIQGTGSRAGAVAIVVDPGGSAAAMASETVQRLRKEGRSLLVLDVFQTGAAKAPRNRQDAQPVAAVNGTDETAIEHQANVAVGGPQFLTFNVTDDAARVQDIVTAIAYAGRSGRDVEVYAKGDAALWATFAAAVSRTPVSLHLENAPPLTSDADYLEHFDVPGILRAGGLAAAQRLASSQ
jgi:dienelactone hydrolase